MLYKRDLERIPDVSGQPLTSVRYDEAPIVIGDHDLVHLPPPQPHTLEIAQQIRQRFGSGGARFPGASELYQAAEKIEAWAAATAVPSAPSGNLPPDQ